MVDNLIIILKILSDIRCVSIVPVTVAQADWQDVQLGHVSLAQDDRQPLIVGYVLISIGKVAAHYIVM